MRVPLNKSLLFLLILFLANCWVGAQSRPVIDLWYGKEQTFGKPGAVQRWVNVLGNVDPMKNIVKLDFALNDGDFRPLSIGPDNRRLQRAGDFNVEIPIQDLVLGKNTILIEAVDKDGTLYSEVMELTWSPEASVADVNIDWSEVDELTDVAQPIDGLWRIEGENLVSAPEALGYDRVIGLGDMSWTDYEVLFPFEIYQTDPSSFGSEISVGPALLVILRWQGHTDSPVVCAQPHCGWEPCGGAITYSFNKDDKSGEGSLTTGWHDKSPGISDFIIEPGKPYWMRARAETTMMGNAYAFKIWEGMVENEPEDWSAQTLGGPLNMSRGSFVLAAHHIDLAIGNIKINPLGTMRNKMVDILTEFTDILIQLPYLIIWIVGILWALAYMRRDAGRGRWILVSFSLLFLTSLLGFILIHYLPDYLLNQGWITRRVTYVYVLSSAIPIGGHLLAFAILFKTLWPPKQID
ncbi:MAG: hypothetical protein O7C75_11990 [Verrucomicrobia bacterium]|nr:hypothetical protein [Verrucomicrobiota bacterium]